MSPRAAVGGADQRIAGGNITSIRDAGNDGGPVTSTYQWTQNRLTQSVDGAGDTKSPVIVGVLGTWGIRIPLAWALAFPVGLGLNGIWITMIADWAVRTALFLLVYRRGRWKSIKL